MMKIVYLVGTSLILSIVSTVSANQASSSCLPDDVGLSFKQATLEYNNLGGVGPDNDGNTPEEMRFNNVGQFQGRTLDFVATIKDVEGQEYELAEGGRNGLKCNSDASCEADFVNINMRRNRRATVVFEIQDQQTRVPVELPGFVFSLYDIDEGVTEHYVIKGWSTAQYETTSPEANYTESSGFCEDVEENCLYAKSTLRGHGCDNPTNPMELGTVICKDENVVNQKARSFQVTFEDTSSFELFLWYSDENDNKNSGRNAVISFNSAHSQECEDDFDGLCEEDL